MGEIKILTEAELKRAITLDRDTVDCVAQGFAALAAGSVVMPPVLRLDIEEANGEVDVKTAYVPGLDSFAIKVSPGFFNNPQIGLPSLNGLMMLFSAKTGLVEAMLLDNGYLTALRTAAAGAVAAMHLSREDAESVAIIGAGEQGQLQLEALTLVRPIKRAVYCGRDIERVSAVADKMSKKLGLEVICEADTENGVRNADIILTCTPASSPVLHAGWLQEGQHITAMGSDAEHKNELDPEIFNRIDLYVPDSLSQVVRLGELHHAMEAGVVEKNETFFEIGALVSGARKGRTAEHQITVADLTGTGVQDTAIATLAYSRALHLDIGFNLNN